MANDRGILTTARQAVDALLGARMGHTLVYCAPAALRVRPEHLRADLSPEQRRDLFARSVNFVEIETHSYCNRRCWFCPNSYIDRRTERKYLPAKAYLRILEDLKSIHYHGRFYFSHYNEPFGDDILFERLAQARDRLPRGDLRIHSNGDFLTRAKLDRAIQLGANHLELGIYLANGVTWTREAAERHLGRVANRLHLTFQGRFEAPGERITYEGRRNGTRIFAFCPNYTIDGICRGGSVEGVPSKPVPRTSPCLYAFTDLYVEYSGRVMPCCNLRSDIEQHKGLSFGKVDDFPGRIFEVWASDRAAGWRRAMLPYGAKPGPCVSCQAREWAEGRPARVLHAFITRLHGGWASEALR
jgi:hypothetical protein